MRIKTAQGAPMKYTFSCIKQELLALEDNFLHILLNDPQRHVIGTKLYVLTFTKQKCYLFMS